MAATTVEATAESKADLTPPLLLLPSLPADDEEEDDEGEEDEDGIWPAMDSFVCACASSGVVTNVPGFAGRLCGSMEGGGREARRNCLTANKREKADDDEEDDDDDDDEDDDEEGESGAAVLLLADDADDDEDDAGEWYLASISCASFSVYRDTVTQHAPLAMSVRRRRPEACPVNRKYRVCAWSAGSISIAVTGSADAKSEEDEEDEEDAAPDPFKAGQPVTIDAT